MTGWIKLHRQLQDNPLWTCESFTRGQAWVDILLMANHKETYFYKRGNKISIKRGQLGRSEVELADRWKWSRTKVRKFLNDLEKEQQIIQQKSSVTQILTVIKYSEFQEKEQQTGQQKDSRRTAEEQQKDTYKNDKKEKESKEVLNYLNQKTGKGFRVAKGLKARLDEGYTVDDCKKVIDTKCSQWLHDKKMCQYLKPDTLFSQKFDGYLNEVEKKTYKDLPYNADAKVYYDKESGKVYDEAGHISKIAAWDSHIKMLVHL